MILFCSHISQTAINTNARESKLRFDKGVVGAALSDVAAKQRLRKRKRSFRKTEPLR